MHHRKHFNKLFQGTSMVVRELCDNATYQEEYLKYVPCMKQVADKNQVCFDRYSQAMKEIQGRPRIDEVAVEDVPAVDMVEYQRKRKRQIADEGIKNVCWWVVRMRNFHLHVKYLSHKKFRKFTFVLCASFAAPSKNTLSAQRRQRNVRAVRPPLNLVGTSSTGCPRPWSRYVLPVFQCFWNGSGRKTRLAGGFCSCVSLLCVTEPLLGVQLGAVRIGVRFEFGVAVGEFLRHADGADRRRPAIHAYQLKWFRLEVSTPTPPHEQTERARHVRLDSTKTDLSLLYSRRTHRSFNVRFVN